MPVLLHKLLSQIELARWYSPLAPDRLGLAVGAEERPFLLAVGQIATALLGWREELQGLFWERC